MPVSDKAQTKISSELLEVRATTARINPRSPVVLAANGLPNMQTIELHDDLELNVLLLGRGNTGVAIVTIDALYFGAPLRDVVVQALSPEFRPGQIFCFASHSHNAPALDPTKPRLGLVDATYLAEVSRTVEDVMKQCAALPATHCRVTVGSICSSAAVNRRTFRPLVLGRKPRLFGMVAGCRPTGWVDDTITTITFISDEDDHKVAILWNFACHPVGYPDATAITSHFPGRVRAAVRQYVNDTSLPVAFLQGFSGDCRPAAESTCKPKKTGWRSLLQGPGFGVFTDKDFDRWTSELNLQVLQALRSSKTLTSSNVIRYATAERHRKRFVLGSQTETDTRFGAISLGDSLAILGVSAEVTGPYARWARRKCGGTVVIPAGCMDDVFGYLPTSIMKLLGGYEASGFCRAFSLRRVSWRIEPTTKSAMREVMEKISLRQ